MSEYSNSIYEKVNGMPVFEKYYDTLVNYENANVTAVKDKEMFYVKHVVDSLLALPLIKENASMCDIGCGNGFPSFPLKIMRQDITLTTVDANNKKVTFLDYLARSIGVCSTNLHSRAEDVGSKQLRESFDVVVARAVAPLPVLLEYCLPLVKVGGIFIGYKALLSQEIAESQKAISLLGGGEVEIITHKLPLIDNEEQTRTLVVIKKIKHTPPLYPRKQNKPRLEPLI